MAVHDSSWQLMAAHGSSWQLMAAQVSSSQLKSVKVSLARAFRLKVFSVLFLPFRSKARSLLNFFYSIMAPSLPFYLSQKCNFSETIDEGLTGQDDTLSPPFLSSPPSPFSFGMSLFWISCQQITWILGLCWFNTWLVQRALGKTNAEL